MQTLKQKIKEKEKGIYIPSINKGLKQAIIPSEY